MPETPPKKSTKRSHEESNSSSSSVAKSATVTESTGSIIEGSSSAVKENKHPVTGELSPSKRPRVGLQPAQAAASRRRLKFVGDFKPAASMLPPHQFSTPAAPINSSVISSTSVFRNTAPVTNINSTVSSSTTVTNINSAVSPSATVNVNLQGMSINLNATNPMPSSSSTNNSAVPSSLSTAKPTLVQQLSTNGYSFIKSVSFNAAQSRWSANETSNQPLHERIAIKQKSIGINNPFHFLPTSSDYAPSGSKITKYLCENRGLLYGINLTEINGASGSIILTNIKNKMIDWFQHNKEIKERITGSMELIYIIDCTNCTLSQEDLLIVIGEALCHKAMKIMGVTADLITTNDINIHCNDMPRFHFTRNGTLSSLYHPLTAFARFRNKNPIKQRTLDQFRRSASASAASTPAEADNSLMRSNSAVATTSNNATTSTQANLKRSSSVIVSTSNTKTPGISKYLTTKLKDNDYDDIQVTSTSYTATTSTNTEDTSAKKSRTASTNTLSRNSSTTKTLLQHFAPQTDIQTEENKMKAFEEKYKKHFDLLTNADFWKGWQSNTGVYNSNPDIIPFTLTDLNDMRESFIQIKTEIEKSNINAPDRKMSLLEKCEGVISELNRTENQLNEIHSIYTQQKNEIFALLRINPNSTLASFLLNKYRGDSNANQHQPDNSFIDWINSLTDKQLLEKIREAKQETVRNETTFDVDFLMAHLHSIMPQQAATVLVAV